MYCSKISISFVKKVCWVYKLNHHIICQDVLLHRFPHLAGLWLVWSFEPKVWQTDKLSPSHTSHTIVVAESLIYSIVYCLNPKFSNITNKKFYETWSKICSAYKLINAACFLFLCIFLILPGVCCLLTNTVWSSSIRVHNMMTAEQTQDYRIRLELTKLRPCWHRDSDHQFSFSSQALILNSWIATWNAVWHQ